MNTATLKALIRLYRPTTAAEAALIYNSIKRR